MILESLPMDNFDTIEFIYNDSLIYGYMEVRRLDLEDKNFLYKKIREILVKFLILKKSEIYGNIKIYNKNEKKFNYSMDDIGLKFKDNYYIIYYDIVASTIPIREIEPFGVDSFPIYLGKVERDFIKYDFKQNKGEDYEGADLNRDTTNR